MLKVLKGEKKEKGRGKKGGERENISDSPHPHPQKTNRSIRLKVYD